MTQRQILRTMKVKTFDEVSLSALETAINVWLAALGEETYTDLKVFDPSTFTAIIIYTEE